ncbi:MAG: hypothetical protein GXP35_16080, partial [Actinobacteria bacterium]|nr:hypothetical protein [Actinomycetota bacterium]
MIGFEDACVDSTVGTALLAWLEARERRDVSWFEGPPDSTTTAVEAAVRTVESMQFGELCAAAVDASASLVGPWKPGAAETAKTAARWAEHRRPIAAAIAGQFDAELHAPMAPDSQQWWSSAGRVSQPTDRLPLFKRYGDVYGNGEFTSAGLWTTTDPPSQVHDGLIDVWEIWPGPISRWRLATRPRLRVFEIHRPEDWAALVTDHPVKASRAHRGWELRGSEQYPASTGLPDVGGQLVAPGPRTHLLPDWSRVAKTFDAVHLSWAGFITTEGRVTPIGDEAITMLRYWS